MPRLMDAARTIDFVVVPGRNGWRWIVDSFALFRREPLRWIALVCGYWLVLLAAEALPRIGPLVFSLVKPVFVVGFLAAAWHQERGEKPRLSHLLAGFRSNLATLVALGVVFVVGMVAALSLSTLADGGQLVNVVFFGEESTEPLLTDPRSALAMAIVAIAATPVILGLWFAPALVVFQDATTRPALRASLAASLGNWRAISVFALGLFAVTLVFSILLQAVALAADMRVAMLVMSPFLLVLVAVTSISDWVSYRDVFHHGEQVRPDAAAAA